MKKSSKPCYKCGGNVKMQEGGSAEQDQIMQIIQMFADIQGVDPEEIIQQLQGLSPEEQQQAIQQMMQVVQQGQGQQMRMGGSRYQEGGSTEQDQIMQIIQMFAEIQGVDPQEIMQRLQQLSPEQQQQAIQQMAQVVQESMQQQQGMQQQMMPPEQQAMMAQGGSWYYGGYMNHPMMEPNGYQHPVALFEMGGMNQMKKGGIHIDPRKKGTFKAQATKMGMSVQEAARHILRNKDKYSTAMVRKANFARNFAKEFGGQLDDQDLMELY
jgi:uncharacterized pyridoxal phosphate-containing UPF0001 family protein